MNSSRCCHHHGHYTNSNKEHCRQSGWLDYYCFTLLLLLSLCNPIHGFNMSLPTLFGVFGTNHGYDVGGTESMCWNTIVADKQTDGDVNTLNDGIFGEGVVSTTTNLLPSCFAGTSLDIEPLFDLSEDRRMNTETNYTFRLALKSNITSINSDIFVPALAGKSTIFARLQLCDSVRQASCIPLWDSRGIDNSVTPTQTDVGNQDSSIPTNSTGRWKYNETTDVLVGLSGESLPSSLPAPSSLVFTRWIQWTLKELTENSTAYETQVDITIQLPPTTNESVYFFIGHAIMNFDLPGNELLRVDVAKAIPQNVLNVRRLPVINYVSGWIMTVLSFVVVVTGLIAFATSGFLIYHRNHAIMKLSQGIILSVMTMACGIQIVSTILFLPLHNAMCTFAGPVVLIFLTLVSACLVGRIWRVYSTLAGVQHLGRFHEASTASNVGFDISQCVISILTALSLPCLSRDSYSRKATRRSALRRTVTSGETARLILMLTLPQIMLQLYAVVQIRSNLFVHLTDRGDFGREVCDYRGRWSTDVGNGYAACLRILGVLVAWISRDLPSAFNEKDQIFKASSICSVISFASIGLVKIVNSPTTHPDLQVFLNSVLSIGSAMAVIWILVVPKINRVLSNEKVIISSILGANHSIRQTMEDFRTSATVALDQSQASQGRRRRLPIVHVKNGDALPSRIETGILNVQHALQLATSRFNEGRCLTSAEVTLLQKDVEHLELELESVVYYNDDTATPVTTTTGNNDYSGGGSSSRSVVQATAKG